MPSYDRQPGLRATPGGPRHYRTPGRDFRRRQREVRPWLTVLAAAAVAFTAAFVLFEPRHPEPPAHAIQTMALYVPTPLPAVPREPAARPQPSRPGDGRVERAAARAMPVCGAGARRNCVVDGDTFWLDGEKIRIENIDAPEVEGRCRSEKELAARATRRLSALLSGGPITIDRNGKDRFGRTLVVVLSGHGDVGAMLVSEGLAREWDGARRPWCGA